jgi:predicted dehydrogenase
MLKRRDVVIGLAGSGALAIAAPAGSYRRILGANERLRVGAIGVGGRGAGDLDAVSTESIAALCDVDQNALNAAGARYPEAKRYSDYRMLLDQVDLDAVVIATPDHHHAPATVRALRRGLHVYCEKPLTHTVEEARLVAKLAAQRKLATQMGTQNHEHPGYQRLVEWLQDGVIGPVTQVHIMTDRPGKWWPQGVALPSERPAIPSHLDWELWQGPASRRDYHPAYVPFRWRGWWDYGCGAIGDMAIHLMDPAFWGLQLAGPVQVRSEGPPADPWSAPSKMKTRFRFGPRGDMPAVELFWYEGDAVPPLDIAEQLPVNGSLFIGREGRIAIAHDGFPKLLPEEKFVDFKPPAPRLTPSPGHHRQWIDAAKGEGKTSSPFEYAGPFTECVLLGNIAFRTGQEIVYDPAAGRVTEVLPLQAGGPVAGTEAANKLLGKSYRAGWDL